MNERFPCPCCGLLTLREPPPGTFEICDGCCWEDDAVQCRDPNYRGGANRESLNEARANLDEETLAKWFVENLRTSPDQNAADARLRLLAAAGLPKERAVAALNLARAAFQADEPREDRVLELLDFVTGFCVPGKRVYPED